MSGAIIQYHDQFVMRVLHQQFMILHPIWFIQKQIWSFGRYFFFVTTFMVFIQHAGIVKGGHPFSHLGNLRSWLAARLHVDSLFL